jgi:hypothetical protein
MTRPLVKPIIILPIDSIACLITSVCVCVCPGWSLGVVEILHQFDACVTRLIHIQNQSNYADPHESFHGGRRP